MKSRCVPRDEESRTWKVLVVWKDGGQQFVKEGDSDAVFRGARGKREAQEVADFFSVEIEEGKASRLSWELTPPAQ